MIKQIAPHGGKLVNCFVSGKEATELKKRASKLKSIHLDSRQMCDLEMMASGALSPIKRYMLEEDYRSVVHNMRLANGLPWSIPITLAVSKEDASSMKIGSDVCLNSPTGKPVGVIKVKQKYTYNTEMEAKKVYRTTDEAHPGVAYLKSHGKVYIGGKVKVFERELHNDFKSYRLEPPETRALFKKKGWKRVVGFQTRNPVHRAHEYIQKCALESADGLLLHPLVGATKSDDLSASIRMKSYEILLKSYYPKDRVALSVFPAAMRYAGPREAIFHALVRKNYGCTHFIVGRDHAGVGNYYGTFDAQKIFDEFDDGELGIEPLFFDYTFYCKRCDGMASTKTCPHDSSEHVTLSGTKVREMLRKGKMPPGEFTRPEIARLLIKALKPSK